MANRDGKLIERTLKDFSLSVMSGNSDGDSASAILSKAVKFDNEYRKRSHQALSEVVGANSISAFFNSIQDFLTFLTEVGLDPNKKYDYIVSVFENAEGSNNYRTTYKIGIYQNNIYWDTMNKNRTGVTKTIPLSPECSGTDSTFAILEKSFRSEEDSNLLQIESPGRAGENTSWFNQFESAISNIEFIPYVWTQYTNEDGVTQTEIFPIDYDVLLKYMTIAAVYVSPGR